MRSLFLPAFAAIVLVAVPASAQRLGARTTSAESMVGQMNQASPDEEMRALVAAADAHPLGSLENPIRVGGPQGERSYLSRLRCSDGAVPRIGDRNDAGVGAFGSVVGSFALTCGGSSTRLIFDIYHQEHVETRAPEGFVLTS
ncbi:MAG TPA: hypothetical protein VFO69_12920 [Allosphingosinicella sp.]|nr:hypothetical protein [Allosphingosinicella sp.]